MSTKEEARQALIDIVPHLKIAMSMAKINEPTGKIKLAILAEKEDGSGYISASFDGESFTDDLIAVLDDPELNQMFSAADPNPDTTH